MLKSTNVLQRPAMFIVEPPKKRPVKDAFCCTDVCIKNLNFLYYNVWICFFKNKSMYREVYPRVLVSHITQVHAPVIASTCVGETGMVTIHNFRGCL